MCIDIIVQLRNGWYFPCFSDVTWCSWISLCSANALICRKKSLKCSPVLRLLSVYSMCDTIISININGPTSHKSHMNILHDTAKPAEIYEKSFTQFPGSLVITGTCTCTLYKSVIHAHNIKEAIIFLCKRRYLCDVLQMSPVLIVSFLHDLLVAQSKKPTFLFDTQDIVPKSSECRHFLWFVTSSFPNVLQALSEVHFDFAKNQFSRVAYFQWNDPGEL
jgi:hypothetical protein